MEDYLGTELLSSYDAAASRCASKKVTLAIGNHTASLYFASEMLRQAILASLSGLIIDTETEPEFKIYLWDASCGDNFLSDTLQLKIREYDKQISIFDRKNSYFQYNPEGEVLSYVNTAKRLAFYCVRDPEKLPDYEVSSPMRMILHWFCRMNNMLLVHGAAVAYNGKGVLLTGHGGSGKSTTALLSMLYGFDFAGDDYIAIAREKEKWRAYQVYRGCKLMPDALARLPQLMPFVVKANQTQTKHVLMLNEECGSLVRSLPLDFILRPRINNSKASSIQTLPLMELLTAFAGSTILQMPGTGVDMLRELTAFCREIPAFSFLLGQDFAEIASSLKDFLEAGDHTMDVINECV